jgi:uncharacterized protein
MNVTLQPQPGKFCWLDLAARDAARARRFYQEAFGWIATEQSANGGHFVRLQHGGSDIGSLYQLAHAELQGHVPSHWTPYIAVTAAGWTTCSPAQTTSESCTRPASCCA